MIDNTEIKETIKSDSEVIGDLEKTIFNLLSQAENSLGENKKERARKLLIKANELKLIRGYTKEVDIRYSEVFDKYLELYKI